MPLHGAAVELHTVAMCNKYGVAFNGHWSWYKGVFHKQIGGKNKKMDNKQYTGLILSAVMVAAVFAMFIPVSADPQNPSGSANTTDEPRYTPDAQTDVACGGNITNRSWEGDMLTGKWQGYYGLDLE